MTTLDPTMTLAELATDRPGASRVFHRLGLDFCCGGKRPLSDVCAERGLDVAGILAEIESAQPESNPVRWAERPVSDIVEFIVNHYHARLREELPELVELARRVETRHADRATCPKGLADHLEAHLDMDGILALARQDQPSAARNRRHSGSGPGIPSRSQPGA